MVLSLLVFISGEVGGLVTCLLSVSGGEDHMGWGSSCLRAYDLSAYCVFVFLL
jgi:hypothetical protein